MKHSLDAMKCTPSISFCKALTGGFLILFFMTKKEMLIALQMKIDWMEINTPIDSMYECWYWNAVKDIAILMWFDPDEYWYNWK